MNKRVIISLLAGLAGAVCYGQNPGYLIVGQGGSDYNTEYYQKMNWDGSNAVAMTPPTLGGAPYGMVGVNSYAILNEAKNAGTMLYATTYDPSNINQAGNWHLWTMNSWGAVRTQLTFDHTYPAEGTWTADVFQDTQGAISPDGTKVAYLEQYPYWTGNSYALQSNLFVMSLKGAFATKMFSDDNPVTPGTAASTYSALAWGPDSNSIVVTGQDLYDPVINNVGTSHYIGEAIVNVSTGITTVIHQHYNGAAGSINSIAWSPDGTKIAFWDENGMQYMTTAGNVTSTFAVPNYQTTNGMWFDKSNNLWAMFYGVGINEYSSAGVLQSTMSGSGINTDWGFSIADGPAIKTPGSIVTAYSPLVIPPSGTEVNQRFLLEATDGSPLSVIVTGYTPLSGDWNGTLLNANFDGYGDTQADPANPGYSIIQYTASNISSSPVSVYSGRVLINFKPEYGVNTANGQSFYMDRYNYGNAPEHTSTVTVTVGGKTGTQTPAPGNLASFQSDVFQVYYPAGTFPHGSTQTVNWTETWDGGSNSGSFTMTAP